MDDAPVADALPALAKHGATLMLSLPSRRIGDSAVAALTRRAAELSVPVRFWLLLEREHGYWTNEHNVDQFVRAMEHVARWRDSPAGPRVSGITLDLEPSFDYSEQLRAAQKSDPGAWLALLASHVQPERFSAARDALAGAVRDSAARGLPVHGVTYPLVLDAPPGSDAVEDAFDIPVSGIDWDEVSFMVYQTAFAQQAGSWFGPDLVHRYARAAVERFGDRAGLDLGVVGPHGLGLEPGDRYPDVHALRADFAAARAAGIPPERVRVYGLHGMLDSGGVAHWLSGLDELEPQAPEPRREVENLRATVTALAGLLG